MTRTTRFAVTAAVAAAGALLATAPTTGVAGAAPSSGPAGHVSQGYTPGSQDEAANAAQARRVDAALARQNAAGGSGTAAVTTVYFNLSQAPSYASYIRRAAQIWNNRETNVKLVATSSSNASLKYYEGNDQRGSYYSGNWHGGGYILIDYSQSRQYSPQRIVAHETGHALGLPDHYSGPCSELMSGGGPGPSCTNPYPNRTEVAKVNSYWANGFAPSLGSTARAAFGE